MYAVKNYLPEKIGFNEIVQYQNTLSFLYSIPTEDKRHTTDYWFALDHGPESLGPPCEPPHLDENGWIVGDQDCVQDMHPCLKEESNADNSGQNFGVF